MVREAAPGPAADRAHRAVRGGRRDADRRRRTCCSSAGCSGCRGADARAARGELLEAFGLDRRGRPGREDLLGRHAPPARPRREPGRAAAGAVPRRADHRARPARPQRAVGHGPRPAQRPASRCCSPRSTSRRPTSSPTRSSVVDHGRVIATGTPEELKAKTGAAGARGAAGGSRRWSTRSSTVLAELAHGNAPEVDGTTGAVPVADAACCRRGGAPARRAPACGRRAGAARLEPGRSLPVADRAPADDEVEESAGDDVSRGGLPMTAASTR